MCKIRGPMLFLTSRGLIWKVKLPLKILTFIWKLLHDSLPVFDVLNNRGTKKHSKLIGNKSLYPDINLNSYSPTRIGRLFFKWQRIKTEDPRQVAMLLRKKHWKEMFYSQEELAVEGNLITLQSRMSWVKQFSRLWSWATTEY
uniref:Reverse transcriptase zinc-binding domain-containing protein n=1 Tax=Quercus lobata TaxID=97700 RepID=A0A7N2LBF5_QUELO